MGQLVEKCVEDAAEQTIKATSCSGNNGHNKKRKTHEMVAAACEGKTESNGG